MFAGKTAVALAVLGLGRTVTSTPGEAVAAGGAGVFVALDAGEVATGPPQPASTKSMQNSILCRFIGSCALPIAAPVRAWLGAAGRPA